MSPETGVERLFRDAVLDLAGRADFARPMVNSGRLSRPCTYPMPDAPDVAGLPAAARPGAVAPDAPLGNGWLSEALGRGFVLLGCGVDVPQVPGTTSLRVDAGAEVRARYLGDAAGAVYLVRPDQVVAARWLAPTEPEVAAALRAVQEGRL
jgi:3-(3-hydroxy-phenyl)propionate hydroxylase